MRSNAVIVKSLRSALLLAPAVALLSGCPSSGDTPASTGGETEKETQVSMEKVAKESKEALDAVIEYTAEQKDEYTKAVRANLAALGTKLEDFGQRVEAASEDTKAALKSKLADLQAMKKAAQDKLEKLGAASKEAWSDMKSGVDGAVDELQSSYDDAVSHFGEGGSPDTPEEKNSEDQS